MNQPPTIAGKIPNPDKMYSLREIHALGFFPWVRSYQSTLRFLKKHLPELDAIVVRHETKTTYRIPGEAIARLQLKGPKPEPLCNPPRPPSTAAPSPLSSILNDISTARTGRKSIR